MVEDKNMKDGAHMPEVDEVVEVVDDALRAEAEGAEAVHETLIADRDSWKDKAMRAAAEAENVRKRAAADVMEARQYGIAKFALEMVGVGDNLARALGAPEGNEKALRDGVAMTAALLEQILGRFGAVKIVVKKGDVLNPELHQAVGEMESGEVAPGKIVHEAQVGFTLNGRLLRPSMVMVAKAPEARGGEAVA
ncbi:MAG: nucleotide exchange factor GrpE [Proteobacteria bacterium]|nr:nucleotide exchange factor GrpE [Pseudomonadota bacterium]